MATCCSLRGSRVRPTENGSLWQWLADGGIDVTDRPLNGLSSRRSQQLQLWAGAHLLERVADQWHHQLLLEGLRHPRQAPHFTAHGNFEALLPGGLLRALRGRTQRQQRQQLCDGDRRRLLPGLCRQLGAGAQPDLQEQLSIPDALHRDPDHLPQSHGRRRRLSGGSSGSWRPRKRGTASFISTPGPGGPGFPRRSARRSSSGSPAESAPAASLAAAPAVSETWLGRGGLKAVVGTGSRQR